MGPRDLAEIHEKLDKVVEGQNKTNVSIAKLPCVIHVEKFKSLKVHVMLLWGINFLYITALLTLIAGVFKK